LLIKRHGIDAEMLATQRADEMLAAGDMERQLVCKRILAADQVMEWQSVEGRREKMRLDNAPPVARN